MRPPQCPRPRRQRGIALIVALILLLIMTMLGLSSIRTTSIQERMSANTYDRGLAFQAAEAALRVGELRAKAWGAGTSGYPSIAAATATNNTCSQTTCAEGLCQIPDPDCPVRWEASSPPWINSDSVGGMSITPRYFVEVISTTALCDPSNPSGRSDCKRFRVTATSAADGRSNVILQSIYATE